MKKMLITITMLLIWVCGSIYAQTPTAEDILKNSDAVVNAPQDQEISLKMTLTDKGGNKKVREMKMYQKGDEMRLIRFLSPADQKGVSFLSLPDDVQYLYLPAFHKVRRIASHIKNDNFAGTDFSYDDMSASKYAEEYDATLLEKTDDLYILELIPKHGVEKSYSKLKMWVRQDNFYPVKVEFYDNKSTLWKLFESRNIKKHGEYWVASEAEMTDLKKQHSTKMITEKIKLNKGLSDNIFTKRNLKRVK
ncbi:MAG: outer membrane lipoprotein-sorting protein [Candidatus Cloacimonetes bacterium]|nr:outer membrane lipoprotein-sorting protein [Candidatus Cloacimonadota bacterium]